ncbi:permease prefix domain 1-containing protein [Nonomuraea sp. MCN248]|uniref:Permease prefix domain 1-containing protein n=1 Tax=Nonomuraea corallina TaxID=2989783 RepID=A0ABT4S6J9_9ACTN|nr:permease prefix domain 1-containing protein [Nonomuraea corallina]MDA0632561.1 permease prefix domain 1-containing protein [Nonomuraea corallina]
MLIDDYAAELRRALSGPYGPKRDLVVEARHSLLDCAEAYQAQGLRRTEAERRAVEEFGPVRDVAPGYQEELTASAGRRLGLLLFVSVPATVLAWGLIWSFQPAETWVAADRPEWFTTASRLLDVVQLAFGLYGGLALLALSRPARWIPRPRLVTRSLGLSVWLLLPLNTLLGLLISHASQLPASTLSSTPVVLANVLTYAFAGTQLYCATRCVMLSRKAWPPAAARSR